MEVVKSLAKEGIYTVTMTRSARDPDVKLKDTQAKSYIQHYPDPVNVVDANSLKAVLESVHASAIIFCASSSRLGGSVFDVDDTGVGNAALAAKALDARLIVISALAVDRPDSESFKITNTLGGRLNGIMDAKRNGEENVRRTLSQSKDYVIVRPGVLMSGKSIGPQDIEVNQGDTIGGGLSREALAEVTVGALLSGKRGVTVEAYRKATATALQPEFKLPSGSESTSDTYKGLFGSVKSD
jgi:dTDP-4-dehydrorhamnose reductase